MSPQLYVHVSIVCAGRSFDVSSQEKAQEKTVFNVKLESFDAAAKPKIIKEVKALVPNLTLIEVCQRVLWNLRTIPHVLLPG